MNQTIIAADTAATELEAVLAAALSAAEEAHKRHGPMLVSTTRRVAGQSPAAFFARGAQIAPDRIYWQQPSSGRALVGVGAAQSFTAAGPDRFRAVDAAWQELLAGATIQNEDEAGAPGGPVLMGGFAFDPQHPPSPAWEGFPEALLILPRYMLRTTGAESWLTINLLLWPDSDVSDELDRAAQETDYLLAPLQEPAATSVVELRMRDALPAKQWQATVGDAASACRAGMLEKVVLAREVLVEADEPFDLAQTLRRLAAGYPDCFIFAVARDDRCFLGASPERLVSADSREVRVTCLAGSIRRGATVEEDELLGRSLLESAKNRHEHEVVTRMLRAALEEVCSTVEAPSGPQLLKLRNVQHLYTPLRGRLAGDTRLLEVVERLHPTPAVGGTPRAEAMAFIRACEGMDRGWYAAPVGWLDARGRGEFAVALRSGLVSGNSARLFAGCGIVADSDPAAEYEESRLKLRPMIAALSGA